MTFEGQVIAVTGAAGGLGLEASKHFARAGASVALIDLYAEPLAEARELIEGAPDKIITIAADTADSGAMGNAITGIVNRFGRLDGLIANAGVRMKSTLVSELDDEIWDRTLRVNLRGVFVTCRAAARAMIQAKSGAIVTVASISGQAPRLGQSAYCASKAGVIQLSRVLALELAEHHIRVNTLCPGTINTPMMKRVQLQDGPQAINDRIYGSLERFRPGIPLRRVAEPEDVVPMIAFLLSGAAKHITGQTIFVDGGESIV